MAKLIYSPNEGFSLYESERDKTLHDPKAYISRERRCGFFEFPKHDTKRAEFILALFGVNLESVTQREDVGKYGSHAYVVSDKVNPYIIRVNWAWFVYFGEDKPIPRSKAVKTETKHWKQWHNPYEPKKKELETYYYVEVADTTKLYKFSGMHYNFTQGERLEEFNRKDFTTERDTYDFIARLDYTDEVFDRKVKEKAEKARMEREEAERRRREKEERKGMEGFCDQCGEKAELRTDPFQSEMHGRWVRRWLCRGCYESVLGDI